MVRSNDCKVQITESSLAVAAVGLCALPSAFFALCELLMSASTQFPANPCHWFSTVVATVYKDLAFVGFESTGSEEGQLVDIVPS